MSKFKLTIMVYTIIAFGASILLWSPSSRVPIMPSAKGTPLYSLHPYFTAELLLMLSTVIVCVMAMLISLYSLRRQGVDLIRTMIQNYSIISLAVFTVIVAICGCLTYSQPVYMGGRDRATNTLRILLWPRHSFLRGGVDNDRTARMFEALKEE